MGNLTHVTINFDTSHLIFPTLIGCILGLLGLAIAIRDRRAIAASGAHWRDILGRMDKPRFFGTLALTIAYFSAMVPVGDIWPNTGMGFLLCSIPLVAGSGLLFMRERSLRKAVPLMIVAVAAPVLVWWLFTDLFFLTLP
ncbi:tripartite tricarboxylate transporter TctB family protein [Mangrovicoccus algicola]|uniref:Tripartite tricarboxylate transporter TctB family protein n=1 Tax=Mangrovicoccus algicola TaxID=2771008 RepID=A0A8J6YYH6_9RHOB|nr:tripartite tricarboxylate transporter TctB family protein [Mangrovicoccus algicola]MBE3638316.1 tripartite tricarboxylate transporter TctB family protein [Mangrovicoccus algicola]